MLGLPVPKAKHLIFIILKPNLLVHAQLQYKIEGNPIRNCSDSDTPRIPQTTVHHLELLLQYQHVLHHHMLLRRTSQTFLSSASPHARHPLRHSHPHRSCTSPGLLPRAIRSQPVVAVRASGAAAVEQVLGFLPSPATGCTGAWEPSMEAGTREGRGRRAEDLAA